MKSSRLEKDKKIEVSIIKDGNILSDIVVLNIKVADCCSIVSKMRKSEAENLLQKADLKQKGGTL